MNLTARRKKGKEYLIWSKEITVRGIEMISPPLLSIDNEREINIIDLEFLKSLE